MSKPKIIFTVSNDLVTDQRMQKICSSLATSDFEVELLGRQLFNSFELNSDLPFAQKRLKLMYNKGKLFYLFLNLRMIWYLMRSKADIICAVDVDTLIAGFVASKLKKVPLVFDAHEYYSEVPELIERKKEQRIWQRVENYIIPKLKYKYTVNDSLAKIFEEKWGGKFDVIRNLPRLKESQEHKRDTEKKVIIYQGAVNMGRGLSQLIDVMPKLALRNYELHIYGDGDERRSLEWSTIDQMDYIEFKGKRSPVELKLKTAKAFVGVNLLENKGLNYYYSLANKFWDYAAEGVPQICMNYPEYKKYNDVSEMAVLVDDLEVNTLYHAILKLEDDSFYQRLSINAREMANKNNWDLESNKLLEFYRQIVLENRK